MVLGKAAFQGIVGHLIQVTHLSAVLIAKLRVYTPG